MIDRRSGDAPSFDAVENAEQDWNHDLFGRRCADPDEDARASWPPSNVWLGTSIERQGLMWRAAELCKCPAVVRFLSLEPLLGEIKLPVVQRDESWPDDPSAEPLAYSENHPQRFCSSVMMANVMTTDHRHFRGRLSGVGIIHWVIVGGESGPGARPMHPDWVRSIRDQCKAARVPFFFKGWGAYKPFWPNEEKPRGVKAHEWNGGLTSYRIGTKLAGRLLDGVTHNQMPVVEATP